MLEYGARMWGYGDNWVTIQLTPIKGTFFSLRGEATFLISPRKARC
jgi:hypothetical protein